MTNIRDRRDWMMDAACIGIDPELFFPDEREHLIPQVREVCEGCPVKAECLDYSLEWASHGIWGGIGETARKDIRRGRGEKLKPAIELEQCGTLLGYRRHVKRGDEPCHLCADAKARDEWQKARIVDYSNRGARGREQAERRRAAS